MERDLYSPISRSCQERYYIIEEVLMRHRAIDMLLIDKQDKKTFIAMEFKLKDFKKAVIQALSYQLVADYSYIVFHDKYLEKVDMGTLKMQGIGLISANENDHEIILRAPRNHAHDKTMRDLVLKNNTVKAIMDGH